MSNCTNCGVKFTKPTSDRKFIDRCDKKHATIDRVGMFCYDCAINYFHPNCLSNYNNTLKMCNACRTNKLRGKKINKT